MGIEFSKIKECEINRILPQIKTYLGKTGAAYVKDTCCEGRYNPKLADFSKYHDEDRQVEVTLKNQHAKLLRIYNAKSLEDLGVDVETEYQITSWAFDSEDLRQEDEVLSFYRKYSDLGVEEASYIAGILEFAGFGCEPDPEGALVHFLKIKDSEEDKYLNAWIGFFTNEPDCSGAAATYYRDYVKFGYVATKKYNCPLHYFQPEWYVFQILCASTPGELLSISPVYAETANELFEIHQYRYCADKSTPDSELPNFAFKPLGLEITWYKDQKAMSMNLPLTLEQLRHILRLCIQYIIDNKCWRGKE